LTALLNQVFALAWQGDVDAAQAALDVLLDDRAHLGDLLDRVVHSAMGLVRLAAGDAAAASEAYEAALQRTPLTPATVSTYVVASLPLLARGDLTDYYLAHSARADLCRRLGRTADAIAAYERALHLTRQEPERQFLERRLRELGSESKGINSLRATN